MSRTPEKNEKKICVIKKKNSFTAATKNRIILKFGNKKMTSY